MPCPLGPRFPPLNIRHSHAPSVVILHRCRPDPERQTLFKTRWLSVHRIGHWDFIERPNADACVAILPITPDDEIVLVEQFRIPVQQPGDRNPGRPRRRRGKPPRTNPSPTPPRRELLEETGFPPARITPLLDSPTSAGMTSETTHLFLATDLVRQHEGGGIGAKTSASTSFPRNDLRGQFARGNRRPRHRLQNPRRPLGRRPPAPRHSADIGPMRPPGPDPPPT